MLLFYTPEIESHHQSFILSEDESKHAIRVLRLKEGDTIYLIDGCGGLYKTEIIDPHPKRTTLHVIEAIMDYGKCSYQLHMAVAPTKNMDRLEWFLEKATEIGVYEFTPIICAHSERKEVKVERLKKVVVAAAKQSLKAYIPIINSPVLFSTFLQKIENDSCFKGIAHCVDMQKAYITNSCKIKDKYLVLIGPEGDFSDNEISQAIHAGFVPLSLGESRLRTETAALAAVLEIALLNRS